LDEDEEENPSSSPEMSPIKPEPSPIEKPVSPQTGQELTPPPVVAKRGRGRPPKKPKLSSPPSNETTPQSQTPQPQQHSLEPLFDMSNFNTDVIIFPAGLETTPPPPLFYPPENINCEICMHGDDEEKLILCDKCDKGKLNTTHVI
jgi:hypothetical protein